MSKRLDYISWDHYFMGIAKLSGNRSKDPNTQVGACLVNNQKRIIGIGYNGFPRGVDDDVFPWTNEGKYLDTKYPYVVHAEANAILNSTLSLEGSTLYVTLFPCNECAKLIIQSGVKEVIYISDKYGNSDQILASKRMLNSAKIKIRQLEDFRLKYEKISS